MKTYWKIRRISDGAFLVRGSGAYYGWQNSEDRFNGSTFQDIDRCATAVYMARMARFKNTRIYETDTEIEFVEFKEVELVAVSSTNLTE